VGKGRVKRENEKMSGCEYVRHHFCRNPSNNSNFLNNNNNETIQNFATSVYVCGGGHGFGTKIAF
jgi:hypothetical protein